jgi:hypothetical protein
MVRMEVRDALARRERPQHDGLGDVTIRQTSCLGSSHQPFPAVSIVLIVDLGCPKTGPNRCRTNLRDPAGRMLRVRAASAASVGDRISQSSVPTTEKVSTSNPAARTQHLSLDKGVGYFGVSADDVADFESTRIHGELSSFLDKS